MSATRSEVARAGRPKATRSATPSVSSCSALALVWPPQAMKNPRAVGPAKVVRNACLKAGGTFQFLRQREVLRLDLGKGPHVVEGAVG